MAAPSAKGSAKGSAEGSPVPTSAKSPRNTSLKDDKPLVKFIKRHLKDVDGKVGMKYTDEQILTLLDRVKGTLQKQDMLVRVRAPIKVVGDIHGQYTDLKRILRAEGRPPDTKYLFLGDYVDRGKHSLEVIMLLFSYKALYPSSIVLLRGNHEFVDMNSKDGFLDELQRRKLDHLHPEFNAVFNWLPIAGLVNGKIMCMHGGISQHLHSMDQIKDIARPLVELEEDTLINDLLWADPRREIIGFKFNDTRESSCYFGMDALENFCKELKIELVVRGHEVVEAGFDRFMVGGRTRLVSIFSAPNYCNQGNNACAVMRIKAGLRIDFSVLEASADAEYVKQRESERVTTPKIDIKHKRQPVHK